MYFGRVKTVCLVSDGIGGIGVEGAVAGWCTGWGVQDGVGFTVFRNIPSISLTRDVRKRNIRLTSDLYSIIHHTLNLSVPCFWHVQNTFFFSFLFPPHKACCSTDFNLWIELLHCDAVCLINGCEPRGNIVEGWDIIKSWEGYFWMWSNFAVCAFFLVCFVWLLLFNFCLLFSFCRLHISMLLWVRRNEGMGDGCSEHQAGSSPLPLLAHSGALFHSSVWSCFSSFCTYYYKYI